MKPWSSQMGEGDNLGARSLESTGSGGIILGKF